MSALEFVCFAAVVLLLYYLLPRKAQPAVMLSASVFYCLSVSLFCLVTLLGVTVNTFFSSITIERKRSRRALAVGVLLTLSSFVITKVATLFEGSSVIFRDGDQALGLAFYSLSAVAYLVDLYRGRIKREKSFLRLFLFVGFFPCLRLGPISRYSDLAPQLSHPHAPTWDNITSGALRVSWGYFKKIVIADTALVALRTIAAEPQKFGGGYALFLIILYSVVIYADFTGGIDVAIGVGRALGIRLAENFDRPFASTSVREYWKRWHITLGAFFSDYVFYPVSISNPMRKLSRWLRGGRFKKAGRHLPIYLALVLTWLLTGAWHGLSVNFILWGLSNAVVIIISQELSPFLRRIEGKIAQNAGKSVQNAGKSVQNAGKSVQSKVKIVQHKEESEHAKRKCLRPLAAARTFLIIGSIRLFDLWSNAATAPRTVISIFSDRVGWTSFFSDGLSPLGLSASQWIVLALGVALIFAVSRADADCGGRAREPLTKKPFAATACLAILVLTTLIFGSYGVGFEESSFIYSQF